MKDVKDQIGFYPVEGTKGREAKLFYKLNDENGLKIISGKRTPALLSIWCSNDLVQFGTIKILSGGAGPWQTEYDRHKGDAVFYIAEGTLTFFLKERKETYVVQQGDFMFIPEGEDYKIINYYAGTAKAVFAIAPQF